VNLSPNIRCQSLEVASANDINEPKLDLPLCAGLLQGLDGVLELFRRHPPLQIVPGPYNNNRGKLAALVLPKVAQNPLKIELPIPVSETCPAHGVNPQPSALRGQAAALWRQRRHRRHDPG